MKSEVLITAKPIDLIKQHNHLAELSDHCGAEVTFLGRVRPDIIEGHEVTAITLEHYPMMTEKAVEAIIDNAAKKWDLKAVLLVHRVGELRANDPIVFLGVSSLHRKDALQAVSFIMDFLKNDVPLWKKEHFADKKRWVEQKISDIDSKNQWD